MTAAANEPRPIPVRIPLPISEAIATIPPAGSLMDLFPAAAMVSHAATEAVLGMVREAGKTISCRSGCGACCRELVSISLVEAVRLAIVVEELPPERRAVIDARFDAAKQRLRNAGFLREGGPGTLPTISQPYRGPQVRSEILNQLSQEYFALGIPCPFLEDESCSIYPDRPMVCREFHVTSPAEWCADMNTMPIDGVVPSVRMCPVLTETASDAGLPLSQVPLVLSLEWGRHYRALAEAQRDGPTLGRLFGARLAAAMESSRTSNDATSGFDPNAELTASIDLKIRNRDLRVQVTVPAGPTSPKTLLPLALQLVDVSVRISAEDSAKDGKPVSCGEGCAACCRHPVPLSEYEAWRLAGLVGEMPKIRQDHLRERFAQAKQQIADAGLTEATHDTDVWIQDESLTFGQQYIDARIACPFLENERCSIYEDRPLICREFLVTSPPEHCATPFDGAVERLPLPFGSGFRSFATAAADQPPDSPISWVLLPHLLEWTAENPEPPPDRRGPDVLKSVFGHLTGR